MKAHLRIAAFCAAWLLCGSAAAQSAYPDRPVRMIAPFAPGGPVDIVARMLAPGLSQAFGQQFYVENHLGASGNIGTAIVAKAPPDGYTILVISSTLVVNPSLFANLGFDTTADLAPVSLIGVSPQVLLVHPSVPASSVMELVQWVRASPGKYSYAHAGLGTPGYLAGEMLKQAFRLELLAVSFNGGGPAITSTIGGHTPILYTSISTAGGHVRDGTVRPLAVTSSYRSPALPQVPCLAERLRPLSTGCIRKSCASCPRCMIGSRRLALSPSAARPRNLRNASARKSTNGRRSSARRASARSRLDGHRFEQNHLAEP